MIALHQYLYGEEKVVHLYKVQTEGEVIPVPTNKIIARLKFPQMGIEPYQSRLQGKSQNQLETIWILAQIALTASNKACIRLLSYSCKFILPLR